MYPVHLANDAQKIYSGTFKTFAARLNARALALLEKSHHPALHDSTDKASESVIHDADIFIWLENLRKTHGDEIPKEQFKKQIEMNYQQVNAFSRAQFMKSIQGARNSLRTPPVSAPKFVGTATMQNTNSKPLAVPPVDMTRGENLAREKVAELIRNNLSMIDSLSNDHVNEVISAIRDGVIHGKSNKEIAAKIDERTSVGLSRAAFWAEDQVGNLFGDVTQVRQQSAGFDGYIWRTLLDNRVRDKHAHLEGTYHTWKNPPAAGSSERKIYVHPGQDWRCRCYAEPARGPQDAKKQYNPDPFFRDLIKPTNKATEATAPQPLKSNFVGQIISSKDSVIFSANKYLRQQLMTMSRTQRLEYVQSALSATWDQSNFESHDRANQFHDFSELGLNSRDVSMDILRNGNYDRIFAFMHGSPPRRRIGFYSEKYNAFVPVDINSGKVASCFILDATHPDDYLSQYLELK